MLEENRYKEIFEEDKDHPLPVAIHLIQKVAESGLPMEEMDRAIAIIKELAKEYGVEISDATY